MKRRSPLRPSFVITLAATSALGCGASVTINASDVPDDGAVRDEAVVGDRPVVVETDVRRACPSTLPTAGTVCTPGVDPETCTDPARTMPGCPSGVGTTVRCDPALGRWQELPVFCNPPPPAQCPPATPTGGSPCPPGTYLSTPMRCAYGNCDGVPTIQATCEGPSARWVVLQSSCNPPPPIDAGFPPDA